MARQHRQIAETKRRDAALPKMRPQRSADQEHGHVAAGDRLSLGRLRLRALAGNLGGCDGCGFTHPKKHESQSLEQCRACGQSDNADEPRTKPTRRSGSGVHAFRRQTGIPYESRLERDFLEQDRENAP